MVIIGKVMLSICETSIESHESNSSGKRLFTALTNSTSLCILLYFTGTLPSKTIFIPSIYLSALISSSSIEIGEKKEPGKDYEILKEKLANLKMKTDFGTKTHERAKLINGKTYELRDNPCGWKWFRLDLDEDEGSITYENARGEKTIKFGLCEYKKITFPETHYYDRVVDTPSNREFDPLSCGAWNFNNLLIKTYITDTNKGNLIMNIGFTDNLKETVVSLVKVAEFFLDDYNGTLVGKLKEE
jgi:hypothetical protein